LAKRMEKEQGMKLLGLYQVKYLSIIAVVR
jgi:hypothetical protein